MSRTKLPSWMNSRFILLTLSMLLVCVLCSANIIYVQFGADPTGADGTLDNPYPTINQALTLAEPIEDCIIDISPGIYEERLSICNRTSSLQLRSHYSETLNNYSVIEQTVIKADAGAISYSAVELLSNTGNISFWGLTVTGGRVSSLGEGGSGIRMVSNPHVSISNCVITDNSALCGGGVFARLSNVTISKTEIIENHLVVHEDFANDFRMGAGIYHYGNTLIISDSNISDNDAGIDYGIGYHDSWAGGIYYNSFSIAGSYFELVRSVVAFNKSELARSSIHLDLDVFSAQSQSKIEHCVIYSNHSMDYYDAEGPVYIHTFSNSFEGIKNCIIRDNTYGTANTFYNIQIKLNNTDNTTPSLKHCVTHKYMVNGVETEYFGVGNLYVNPRFVDASNGDFQLAWDEDGPSPCINAGYPGVNNEFTDPDGTIPDIGVYYYPHYYREYFDRPSLISWLSFPVVDDKTNINGTHWNELGYMFQNNMGIPPNSPLNQVQWSYNGNRQTMSYDYDNSEWSNTIYRSSQPLGYKVQFNQGQTISSVVVNGFKADPDTTPAIWVESVVIGDQTQSFENWIGYFVPFTQRAGDALSRIIPGSDRETYLDYVYSIETRTWCARRLSNNPGSDWIIDPNHFTLSEGEMASLSLIRHAPQEMYWYTEGLHVTPIVRPPATAFEYEEMLDYIPIFIEFDPQDLPDEVGLFVDGVCKGAAVVDSSLINVCFYNDVAKDEAELEIMFYYEGKGKKAAKGWKSYNPDSMVFEDNAIRINEMGSYAYLSFNRSEGDSPVPLVTGLQPNYPNPFNPSTTLSFILSSDMNARVEIYNVRGQKVKILLNSPLGKGKHTLEWNGKDENGRSVSSGIYFSRLNTADGSFVNKMMLMK